MLQTNQKIKLALQSRLYATVAVILVVTVVAASYLPTPKSVNAAVSKSACLSQEIVIVLDHSYSIYTPLLNPDGTKSKTTEMQLAVSGINELLTQASNYNMAIADQNSKIKIGFVAFAGETDPGNKIVPVSSNFTALKAAVNAVASARRNALAYSNTIWGLQQAQNLFSHTPGVQPSIIILSDGSEDYLPAGSTNIKPDIKTTYLLPPNTVTPQTEFFDRSLFNNPNGNTNIYSFDVGYPALNSNGPYDNLKPADTRWTSPSQIDGQPIDPSVAVMPGIGGYHRMLNIASGSGNIFDGSARIDKTAEGFFYSEGILLSNGSAKLNSFFDQAINRICQDVTVNSITLANPGSVSPLNSSTTVTTTIDLSSHTTIKSYHLTLTNDFSNPANVNLDSPNTPPDTTDNQYALTFNTTYNGNTGGPILATGSYSGSSDECSADLTASGTPTAALNNVSYVLYDLIDGTHGCAVLDPGAIMFLPDNKITGSSDIMVAGNTNLSLSLIASVIDNALLIGGGTIGGGNTSQAIQVSNYTIEPSSRLNWSNVQALMRERVDLAKATAQPACPGGTLSLGGDVYLDTLSSTPSATGTGEPTVWVINSCNITLSKVTFHGTGTIINTGGGTLKIDGFVQPAMTDSPDITFGYIDIGTDTGNNVEITAPADPTVNITDMAIYTDGTVKFDPGLSPSTNKVTLTASFSASTIRVPQIPNYNLSFERSSALINNPPPLFGSFDLPTSNEIP